MPYEYISHTAPFDFEHAKGHHRKAKSASGFAIVRSPQRKGQGPSLVLGWGNNKVCRDTDLRPDLQEDTVRQSASCDTCVCGACKGSIFPTPPLYFIGVGKEA